MVIFLKTNTIIYFWHAILVLWVKIADFFDETISETITSTPGRYRGFVLEIVADKFNACAAKRFFFCWKAIFLLQKFQCHIRSKVSQHEYKWFETKYVYTMQNTFNVPMPRLPLNSGRCLQFWQRRNPSTITCITANFHIKK
jgi:hypothetical protein